MSEEKVQRFTGIQIALHWCQALLYLTLLVTGGAILLRRLTGIVTPPGSFLPIIHRLVGVGLLVVLAQMLIAAAVTRRLHVLGRDIFEWFLLYPRDVLWLIKAPLSVFIPGLRMPAAGRYNAGQKLHGAFVSLAVTTFIVTGMAMMIVPGVLISWVIHASLFGVAVVFLCLHLFMTLINPATRRAIGGMFTGFVPRHYAESHHPMWIDSSSAGREARPAPPRRSRPSRSWSRSWPPAWQRRSTSSASIASARRRTTGSVASPPRPSCPGRSSPPTPGRSATIASPVTA